MTVSYEKSVHLILSQIADSSASLMRGASVSSSNGLKGRVLAHVTVFCPMWFRGHLSLPLYKR